MAIASMSFPQGVGQTVQFLHMGVLTADLERTGELVVRFEIVYDDLGRCTQITAHGKPKPLLPTMN